MTANWASELIARKARGEILAVLTAYDYPTAKLLEEAGVDLLLVGDSLGMVVLGYPDTTQVTMADMLHHLRAVRRGVARTPIIADLPTHTYDTMEDAVANGRLLMDAGADAVKLEGGRSHSAQIAALTAAGFPVVAHLGMLPQSVKEEGGYKIKGKTPADADRLLEDALAIQAAGAIAVVLELVQADTALRMTQALHIPTIGIGAGKGCDGQVLVTHDLVGLFPWFTPKFARPRAQAGVAIREAAHAYVNATHARE